MSEADQQKWREWCEQMLATDLSKQSQWYVKKDMMFAAAMLDLLNTVAPPRAR
jgi:hypothetical protein